MDELIDGLLRMLFTLLAFFVPLLALTALYEWAVENRPGWFSPTPTPPPRRDARIPADEKALLGDDWRDAVTSYFVSKQPVRSDDDPE